MLELCKRFLKSRNRLLVKFFFGIAVFCAVIEFPQLRCKS